MTQEDKELLLKYLCAILPYNTLVHIKDINVCYYDNYLCEDYLAKFRVNSIIIEPYLRPIDSMTEEERQELSLISEEYLNDWSTADSDLLRWKTDAKVASMSATFYNSHHLDWNGLIPMGLALEASKDMYKK